MATIEGEPLRVLRFWRDLEIFNIPTAPTARDGGDQTHISTLRQGDTLPWSRAQFKPTESHGHVHVVHLGVADTGDMSQLLLRTLFPDRDLSERERQRVHGSGWLAAFVVDESGIVKLDSYLPTSFVHGVAALRETGALANVNARLARAKDEFAQRRCQIASDQAASDAAPQDATAAQPTVDWGVIEEEQDIVRRLLDTQAEERCMDWRLVVRTTRVQRRYLDESLQTATDFLNSFYVDDLDHLIAQAGKKRPFGKGLATYLGQALPKQQRVDILTEQPAMSGLVSATLLPSARWPASTRHPLVLAQQAAVSHAINALGPAEGLIGINGPPGTGKTTLLCDVIAEIITARARRIAALSDPADLFEDKMTVAGKSFFPLQASIVAGTSIVVTSTNNNAVKNISQELPARKKLADEFGEAEYFADVMREIFRAQKVLDDEEQPIAAWGLIAAALGNSGNRRSFAQGFFRDEYLPKRPAPGSASAEPEAAIPGDSRAPSMKQILETASSEFRRYRQEWDKARLALLALQTEFDRCREILERAEKAALRLDAGRQRLEGLAAQARALNQDIQACEQTLATLHATQSTQRAIVDAKQIVLAALRAGTPRTWWDRLMGLWGRETPRMATLRHSQEGPTRELDEASTSLAQAFKDAARVEAGLTAQRSHADELSSQQAILEQALESDRQALQAGHASGAAHFPDAQFWALPADMRHRASIAVHPQLDALRAKLFLQAMALHRLTVLANAGKFISNLRAVNGMLTGGSRGKLSPEHRPRLWEAFFFVVPVVSTTLASFDRLFVGMGQESLGWLLIDESGQATPQSAAGAIWRSRRTVVVGDPLQIEPVFTVPRGVAEDLRSRHGVDASWSAIDESVQTLADRITPFGSWIETARGPTSEEMPQPLWTGMPLRTHRRCDDPMFSVANRIAYAGQMVQGSVDAAGRPVPSDFSCNLGESAWIDVRSDRVNHPVSDNEIACLLDGIAQLQRQKNKKTQVFVISPFRKVSQACRARISAAKLGNIDCGTVHTFQGKEAHIVFLVLGTAPGQAGSGARNWAASKPNLLNVAITRAKCRLYVIGDASQWGNLDHFRELLLALPTRAGKPGVAWSPACGADAVQSEDPASSPLS